MSRLPVHGPEGPIRAVTAPQGPPAAVRAVLFDFSGTLFQIGTYADRIRAALARPVDEAEMAALLDGLEAGLSDPAVAGAQRARDVSAEAHRHAFTTWYDSVPGLAPVAGKLYEQLRTPGHWVPYADSAAVLARLAGAGVALGVVSDVGWDLRPTFAHHRLDGWFSSWTHSFEHGTEKPDPRLFLHACRELGAGPAETLMVGDHPVKDGGAAGAGLRSYVLPAGAAPGQVRGLDAVLRLAGIGDG
ncbi:HAD family hydrolase [Streptomyces pini]|uniref:Haloacid dehalogenase superfamily, subfamily IA, variant 2 with 3rd motif like haloacid dehalogenase/haloacid dehalogenase superfamily, subfamily IA, variant 1 with third motif having Dx(3-4)D or D... n=1 Tax=Streptomyces pini TaxID=1520580 RepID=A0A1I3YMH5_9ACTN|nr:HAD-IA family hydrolase [Streptomyces pini]SFK32973.1 Haloacid dehalogenase superfamily, subfamily IA, variant 2 with 3rd motif like haloacid dehalogenase/haloacid dehalogenase superfamily, subfamily IA, variant 1 with third motif having Dx(3-4)D or Dx(3-4)E [Streptomyces pini]